MYRDTALPERGVTNIAEAYERLRSDIVSARIPPGSKLAIETLKRQYDLGPSPLREALNRLAAEGWVDHKEQRGFHVASADSGQYLELLKARIWAEGMALRDAVLHRNRAWEDRVILSLHHLRRAPRFIDEATTEENPEWERLHREFHMALLSNCTSSYMVEFCARLYDHAHRYRMLALRLNQGRRQESHEHQAIADAALDGKADEAVALLVEHYNKTASIIGLGQK